MPYESQARCTLWPSLVPVMSLYSLIYVSSAQVPFSKPELTTLLEIARRNNAAVGVTGMLLYKDGNFMQAIEGEEDALQKLHEKIQKDPRHGGMLTLLKKPIEERQFPDWTMAFRNLADDALREQPGYNEFLNTPLTEKEFSKTPSRAQKLLLAFKTNT